MNIIPINNGIVIYGNGHAILIDRQYHLTTLKQQWLGRIFPAFMPGQIQIKCLHVFVIRFAPPKWTISGRETYEGPKRIRYTLRMSTDPEETDTVAPSRSFLEKH